MNKTGIILEGGAMRCIFTAGVMDFFLDKKLDIPNILAISGGAYAGMNYVSGQKGRIIDSVVKPMSSKEMMGLKNFFLHGEFFNMDLIFNKIPRGEWGDCPFDFEAFKNSGKRFITSTINCKTGEAVYFDEFKDLDEFCHIIKVANSLPLLSHIDYIDGVPMMDGGMADAIPIDRALYEGWDKIIVVLTRDATYRKKNKGDIYNSRFVKFAYRKQKGLLQSIASRPMFYNSSIEKVIELEREGRAFVIRPEGIQLSNGESDKDTLLHYYNVGYEIAEKRYDDLMKFLNS